MAAAGSSASGRCIPWVSREAPGASALWACGSQACPSGCLGTCDQTAIGATSLYRGQAVDRRAFLAPHEAEDRADAGHGWPPLQGVGVMVCTGCEEGEVDLAPPRIVIADAREIDFDTLGHSRLRTALGDSIPVGVGGHFCADHRQMIRAVGMVDVGQALGPLAGQRPPAPAQVAGGPPGSRIDLGLRAPTTAKKGRNVVGIERVVFGLAPREGFHVEGVTQHDGNPLLSTEISQPVPGEEPFDTDADIRASGRDGLEQRFWGCWPVTVHQNLPPPGSRCRGPMVRACTSIPP